MGIANFQTVEILSGSGVGVTTLTFTMTDMQKGDYLVLKVGATSTTVTITISDTNSNTYGTSASTTSTGIKGQTFSVRTGAATTQASSTPTVTITFSTSVNAVYVFGHYRPVVAVDSSLTSATSSGSTASGVAAATVLAPSQVNAIATVAIIVASGSGTFGAAPSPLTNDTIVYGTGISIAYADVWKIDKTTTTADRTYSVNGVAKCVLVCGARVYVPTQLSLTSSG